MRYLYLSLVVAGSFYPQAMSPEQRRVLDMINTGRHVQALEELNRLLPQTADAASRSELLGLLGVVENYFGHFEKARVALEEAIPLCERLRPPAWASQVSMMVSLAEAHTGLTRLPEAYQVLRRALAIAEDRLGPDHIRMAAVLDGLGVWYVAKGNWSRAEASVRRALAILAKGLGPDDRSVASETSALVYILIFTGRHGEALGLAERNTRTFARVLGPTHPDALQARWLEAAILVKTAPAAAEQILREVMAAWTSSQPERHPAYLGMLSALVVTREAQQDLGEAISLSERALVLARELLGPDHFNVVVHMYQHARLLEAGRRGKEATKLRKQAAGIRERNSYPSPNQHSIDIWTLRGR